MIVDILTMREKYHFYQLSKKTINTDLSSLRPITVCNLKPQYSMLKVDVYTDLPNIKHHDPKSVPTPRECPGLMPLPEPGSHQSTCFWVW